MFCSNIGNDTERASTVSSALVAFYRKEKGGKNPKNVLTRQKMRVRHRLSYEITACDGGATGPSASERLRASDGL